MQVAARGLGPRALAAKDGAFVALAPPFPRDAEPGSIINVEFTVMVLDGDELEPMTGSPIVLKLIGPDGTTTEAIARELIAARNLRVITNNLNVAAIL